jgi:hypothetical protein
MKAHNLERSREGFLFFRGSASRLPAPRQATFFTYGDRLQFCFRLVAQSFVVSLPKAMMQ